MINRREALALLAGAVIGSGVSPRAQTQMPRSRRIISAGLDTYLIETDGTVKAWSLLDPPGAALGLGYDTRIPRYTAFEIPGLRNVVNMACASNAGYALLANGSIVSWGSNARGELGNTPLADVERLASSRGNSSTPTPVVGISDAVHIAAGAYHALAVTRGGEVFVWGYGIYEQLGFEMPIIRYKNRTPGAMQYLPFPLPVPGLRDVVAVAGGSQHSLALLKDGTIRAWGTNRDGQVGDGTTTTRTTPVAVIGVRNAVAIAANGTVSAALLADGTVMTWGNGNGGLGRKTLIRDAANPTPALVDGVTGISSLAIGSIHMVAITNTGTVMSWGDNMIGEIGHRGASPAPIPGLTNVASVAAYTGRTFAVLANGTIMALGHVPFWARIEGGDPNVVGFPIPLVIKNLNNPL